MTTTKQTTKPIKKPIKKQLTKAQILKKEGWTLALLKKEITAWKKEYVGVEGKFATLSSFYLRVPKRTISGWKYNDNKKELYEFFVDNVWAVVEHEVDQKIMTTTNMVAGAIFYGKSALGKSDRPELQEKEVFNITLDLGNSGPNKLNTTKEEK